MNAKVEISKQSIPFYAAPDALNAYTSALNVAVQIRTLINQITKSAIQVKGCAGDSGSDPTVCSELEKITSIGKLLVDNSVYDSVDSILSDIDQLVRKIQENPKKYIKISVF